MTCSRAGERGAATAELAVALPALLVVLGVALAGVQLGIDRVRCLDAAQVGARLLARGEPEGDVRARTLALAPEGATVELAVGKRTVSVVVSSHAPGALEAIGVRLRPGGRGVARREDAP